MASRGVQVYLRLRRPGGTSLSIRVDALSSNPPHPNTESGPGVWTRRILDEPETEEPSEPARGGSGRAETLLGRDREAVELSDREHAESLGMVTRTRALGMVRGETHGPPEGAERAGRQVMQRTRKRALPEYGGGATPRKRRARQAEP